MVYKQNDKKSNKFHVLNTVGLSSDCRLNYLGPDPDRLAEIDLKMWSILSVERSWCFEIETDRTLRIYLR